MTRTLAVIENGTVVNVIVAEDDMPIGAGQIDVTDYPVMPGISWTASGKTFTPPLFQPVPAPPDPFAALQSRIDTLQSRIAVLEAKVNVVPLPGP